MSEIKKLAKELQDYTRVVGSHNKHIQSVANRLVELTDQPQLNENQQSIEDYVKKAIVQLREVNLILNKVYGKDRFAREIQDDISGIMEALKYRYFGEEED